MPSGAILVVDDEERQREIYRDILEDEGYAAETAPSGGRAKSTTTAQGATSRFWLLTAPRSPKRCSRASSSATRKALSRTPINKKKGCSSAPTSPRSFLMKLATPASACRRKSCGRFRSAR